MKIQTNVKAGGIQLNRCESASKSLKVRTGVKAGGTSMHRCESLLAAR